MLVLAPIIPSSFHFSSYDVRSSGASSFYYSSYGVFGNAFLLFLDTFILAHMAFAPLALAPFILAPMACFEMSSHYS